MFPVIHIRVVFAALTRGHDAVQGHLAHDQENDQGDARPYYSLLERYFCLGNLHFRNERRERLHQVEEADCGEKGETLAYGYRPMRVVVEDSGI